MDSWLATLSKIHGTMIWDCLDQPRQMTAKLHFPNSLTEELDETNWSPTWAQWTPSSPHPTLTGISSTTLLTRTLSSPTVLIWYAKLVLIRISYRKSSCLFSRLAPVLPLASNRQKFFVQVSYVIG